MKRARTKLRPDPDKAKAAKHVAYELGMFRTMFNSFSPERADPEKLECFHLHARNLLEFFCKLDDSTNLILPEDFGAPERVKCQNVGPIYGEICERVSHLSWNRLDREQEQREYSDWRNTYEIIQEKAREFFNAIPAESVEWFIDTDFKDEHRHWAR